MVNEDWKQDQIFEAVRLIFDAHNISLQYEPKWRQILVDFRLWNSCYMKGMITKELMEGVEVVIDAEDGTLYRVILTLPEQRL